VNYSSILIFNALAMYGERVIVIDQTVAAVVVVVTVCHKMSWTT
jgi:hypothetical protein